MLAYNKLIVTLVGVALLLLNRHTGVDLSADAALIADLVIGILTAAGVYATPNIPPSPETKP